jgi:hypothetical protein
MITITSVVFGDGMLEGAVVMTHSPLPHRMMSVIPWIRTLFGSLLWSTENLDNRIGKSELLREVLFSLAKDLTTARKRVQPAGRQPLLWNGELRPSAVQADMYIGCRIHGRMTAGL